MKKIIYSKLIYFAFFLIVGGLLLTGCGKEPIMDKLSKDGNYHYRNYDLGFRVTLPPEFIYYQTQRTEAEAMVDIDIFVPTNDQEHQQLVPSYALPIKVRIFTSDVWKNIIVDDDQSAMFTKFGEKNNKIYAVVFWNIIPADWQNKWTDEMRKNIFNSFAID